MTIKSDFRIPSPGDDGTTPPPRLYSGAALVAGAVIGLLLDYANDGSYHLSSPFDASVRVFFLKIPPRGFARQSPALPGQL